MKKLGRTIGEKEKEIERKKRAKKGFVTIKQEVKMLRGEYDNTLVKMEKLIRKLKRENNEAKGEFNNIVSNYEKNSKMMREIGINI